MKCEWCKNEAEWSVPLSYNLSGNGVIIGDLCDGCLDLRTKG